MAAKASSSALFKHLESGGDRTSACDREEFAMTGSEESPIGHLRARYAIIFREELRAKTCIG
jgi:hypothetical protein